ncbi:grisea protein [Magnaporthiopsis poae ATCC 64411]|uniref:Grisea protein n=1 Tax=Magnaporthiopsis poae (strain ATCC 64411 / 73-15) TaxID=644358 RepID=A0A0C4E351_MAGP6|nr:grisea protein [Magnaporthiopsis poae ATCC 64411]
MHTRQGAPYGAGPQAGSAAECVPTPAGQAVRLRHRAPALYLVSVRNVYGASSTALTKCGCGSSAPSPAPEPAPPESPALKGAMSPTRRTFQIQKPTTKAAARKQSFDLATLERMDPESYNIHSAPHYGTPILPKVPSASASENALPPTTSGHSLDYLAALPGATVAAGLEDGADYPLSQQLDGHLTMLSPVIKPETPRSAVGGVTNESYFEDFGTSPEEAEYRADANGDGAVASKPVNQVAAAAPKSCCAGKASSTRVNGNGNSKPPPNAVPAAHQALGNFGQDVSATNGGGGGLANGTIPLSHQMGITGAPVMDPFPSPPVMQPIFFTHAADPTMYIYPPYYGTYQHPIQPPHWRQAMPPPGGLGGYAFPGGHAPAHMGMRAPPPAPAMGLAAGDDAATVGGGFVGMSHQCTCGDACNCLGCPAHPYNEVTQDYVRSAMTIMTEEPTRSEGRDARGAREGAAAPVSTAPARVEGGGGCCGGDRTSPAAGAEEVSPAAAQVQQNAGGTGATEPAASSSPPQAQTPSEASAASEDQTHLSASDFLFVTYPFGCEGETASCQCGDDCQCVGCLIHSHSYADS